MERMYEKDKYENDKEMTKLQGESQQKEEEVRQC